MAGSSLLTLIDDIASLLDDVAVMSKVAVKKTAGVLGDDLALNAEQVSGVNADRELPVVWAVAVGSLKNKCILVPAALLISAFIPWAINPLLMLGGSFLCYEGAHKVLHKLFPSKELKAAEAEAQAVRRQALIDPQIDLVSLEKEKIKGAIRTDFILSAEIIVISLGVLAEETYILQVASLIAVALLITVGVYGLVAAIVKLDDLGLYLRSDEGTRPWGRLQRGLGSSILVVAPYLMRFLGIAGTIAMFLVGGEIIAHTIHPIEVQLHHVAESIAGDSGFFGGLVQKVLSGLVGLVAGLLIVAVLSAGNRLLGRKPAAH